MKRILFLSADPKQHKDLRPLLPDWTLFRTSTVEEASKILSREFGLIIVIDLDPVTLGIDWINEAERLKALFPGVPMIAVSSTDDTEIIVKAYAAGIDELILKPVEADELMESIHRLMKKNQRFKKAMALLL
ncbi:MAG: response regulator [Pseudomonadota bacterium]